MYQPHPGTAQLPEPQRPPAPAPVRTAVKVMYAGAAANLIYALAFIATLDSTEFALGRAVPGRVNQVQHHVLVPAALIQGVIGAGLWLLGLAAVVLLWRGPSSTFFHGRQS